MLFLHRPPSCHHARQGEKAKSFLLKILLTQGALHATKKRGALKLQHSSPSPPSGIRICAIKSPPRWHKCVWRLSKTLP